MSFNKPAFFMLFALVVLLVIMSQTEAVTVPIWCFCKDTPTTQRICSSIAAHWDGGSCGLDDTQSHKLFYQTCENIRAKLNCWN
ncbi:hypothetical protein BGX29_011038 [Mortierella sp. GBA35]|nr:hypothetical protein BGX29_011038 [Mortierella sp. GBA35]